MHFIFAPSKQLKKQMTNYLQHSIQISLWSRSPKCMVAIGNDERFKIYTRKVMDT